jgi:hypothetical protein
MHMRFTSTTSAPIRRAGAGAVAVAIAVAATISASTPAPAVAGAVALATDAVCTNVITLYITPGFSVRSGSGTVTSRGETGTLPCAGRLYGHRITGPGTFAVEETYTHATCLSDRSTGRVSATIPTTSGPAHISGALTGRRLGLVEFVEIAFANARFHGTGPVLPTLGTCLITPITRALVSITGTLRG